MNLLREIHIVSFNIPYPPNYGGVIDVFYKIKTLHELGISIHLHCFKYDRKESKELEKYCKTINYYKRPKTLSCFFSKLPFIVITRSNNKLYENLIKDNLPIIFEGLHTCYYIPQLLTNYKKRKLIVRTHNIEHEYYKELASKEKNLLKKLFFVTESKKLKSFEKILEHNIEIAAITYKDQNHFKTYNKNSSLISAFHPNYEVDVLAGKGEYILYHGNLSVNENIEAANYIIEKISTQLNHKFIIAGLNPRPQLVKTISKHNNVELVANSSNKDMFDLIQNAQINLLLTKQDTGIKLKLLNSLYIGRFCIVNNKMIHGTNLESLCTISNSPSEIVQNINELMDKTFSDNEINNRRQILLKFVNNKKNAQKLINLLD